MIKYFCDKCGCELKEEKKIIVVEMRIYKLLPKMITNKGHYCTECAKTIMGAENYAEAKQAYEEYAAKKEKRRQEQLKAEDEEPVFDWEDCDD